MHQLRVNREEPCMSSVSTERHHAGASSQKRGTMHELSVNRDAQCRSFVSKQTTAQELSVNRDSQCRSFVAKKRNHAGASCQN